MEAGDPVLQELGQPPNNAVGPVCLAASVSVSMLCTPATAERFS